MTTDENQAQTVLQAGALLAELRARYAEPGRRYHTEGHVRAMLALLPRLCAPDDLPLLTLAAWFHDAVYDPRRADNEARSADLAAARLGELGWAAEGVAEIVRLIHATRTHDVPDGDGRGAAFLDADLAVLGASVPEYDAYAGAIRREYDWVADPEYRAGRIRVLKGFLDRPRIYRTSVMAQERETPARKNLEREVERLERGE